MLLTHGYSVKSLGAVHQKKKNKIASVSFDVFYSRLKNILARVQRNCFREESIGKSTLPQEQVQLLRSRAIAMKETIRKPEKFT